MPRAYIFDLDGTCCNIDHRLHLILDPKDKTRGVQPGADDAHKPDWDAFYAACVDDKPIESICELVRHLETQAAIIFVSGRSDAVEKQTDKWLQKHVLPQSPRIRPYGLYMRAHGDHRPDHIVKGEMLHAIRAKGWEIIMAFDDRNQVVKMWREAGIVCAQVADGDF